MNIKGINLQKITRKAFLVTVDICSVIAASIGALLLRFNLSLSSVDPVFLDTAWAFLIVLIPLTIIVFSAFHLYQSLWAYAGVVEFESVVAASVVVSVLQVTIMMLLQLSMPRSYFLLFGMVLVFLVGFSRFGYRALRHRRQARSSKEETRNVMVIGAGEAGNAIVRELISSAHLHQNISCIIDDNPLKIGSYIQGVKVVGNRESILENVEKFMIDDIIIAIPSAGKKEIREIAEICKESKCELKILPGMYQFVTGEASISKLRNVEIGDLLGRDAIEVDLDSIMGYVQEKVVLVSGGGGSIGSELCRQIAAHQPKQLIIIDIYENNAYDIQQELVRSYPKLNLEVLIASVRNDARIEKIFETYHPEIVYHAAAHKHVPLMEKSPNEAVKNNVFGTLTMVKAADKYGVNRFVMISTDKAVNPTNVMGATKRICEMIIQTYNSKSKTEFVAVRFGNVLGSNGSVIPLFKKQLEQGGPITVTHPGIIRYFMTIPEAVSLVLQAGAYSRGGEIFVLNMGEPVRILDLAKNLIRFSGYTPNEDILIEFTGLRPGEKLYEELLMKEEGLRDTKNNLIHIARPISMNEHIFEQQLEELYEVSIKEPENIRRIIEQIVPTYMNQNSEDAK